MTACDPAPSPIEPEPWPTASMCEGLDDWPSEWADQEWDALAQIDTLRSEGADCGERGKFGPAPALVRRPALDCAARFHARDMVDREYVGRLDPEGHDEGDRVEATGYAAAMVVQHFAIGPRDAEQLVDRTWRPRPVPCSSLLSPALTEVGLGVVGELDDAGTLAWVMVLAAPEAPP